MFFDAAWHARISLAGQAAFLLLVLWAAAGLWNGEIAQERTAGKIAPAMDNSHLAQRHAQQHFSNSHFWVTLQRRPPTPAEFRRVLNAVDDACWSEVRNALQVLRTHQRPRYEEAMIRTLRRMPDGADAKSFSLLIPQDQVECIEVGRAILSDVEDLWVHGSNHEELQALVAAMQSRCCDGGLRARALTVLARRPPRLWNPIVLNALKDPSERVRTAALDIAKLHDWPHFAANIEPLASSPRPALRKHAIDVLAKLGRPVQPTEYGDAVMAAAGRLADRLWNAGLTLPEAIGNAPHRESPLETGERLSHRAEDYLDRSANVESERPQGQGVLLLAAAAHLGQRKLTIRLWEREIAQTDSDDELVDRGLETLARNRFLNGLVMIQRGESGAGLRELASVAALGQQAQPTSDLPAYVRHAAELSAHLWQGSTANNVDPRVSPQSIHQVLRVTRRILDQLDLERPEHMAEAGRRLDAWCGIGGKIPSSTRFSRKYPIAN